MIKIKVEKSLVKEIKKKFGINTALKIMDSFETLKENPQRGKKVGRVGDYLIKELKFETFRFYFITNGVELKLFLKKEIESIIIKFIRMSKKNNQQKIIGEIKELIKNMYDDF